MSCGIYMLTFGDDKKYIGLSVDINRRIMEHKNSLIAGNASKRLQDAYNEYGMFTYEVLENCTEDMLSELEIKYIEAYDTYKNGLNSNGGGMLGGVDEFTKFNDTNMYMVKRILEIYVNNIVTTERVAECLRISETRVKSILSGKTFTYLREAYPELYDKALELYNDRKHSGLRQYPKIMNESGNVVQIPYRGAKAFAEANGLKLPNLSKLLKGEAKSCGGWVLYDHYLYSQQTKANKTA